VPREFPYQSWEPRSGRAFQRAPSAEWGGLAARPQQRWRYKPMAAAESSEADGDNFEYEVGRRLAFLSRSNLR